MQDINGFKKFVWLLFDQHGSYAVNDMNQLLLFPSLALYLMGQENTPGEVDKQRQKAICDAVCLPRPSCCLTGTLQESTACYSLLVPFASSIHLANHSLTAVQLSRKNCKWRSEYHSDYCKRGIVIELGAGTLPIYGPADPTPFDDRLKGLGVLQNNVVDKGLAIELLDGNPQFPVM